MLQRVTGRRGRPYYRYQFVDLACGHLGRVKLRGGDVPPYADCKECDREELKRKKLEEDENAAKAKGYDPNDDYRKD